MEDRTLAFADPKPNGETIVLVRRVGGFHPYVTWRQDKNGDNYYGHYFKDAAKAWEDYHDRLKDGRFKGYTKPHIEE